MHALQQICIELGVPLANEKTEGPVQILVFLGLEINTQDMSVRIPQGKLLELKEKLLALYNCRKATVKEIQALSGLLNFCSSAIPCAKAFNIRFYDSISGMVNPRHHVRLTCDLKEDIQVWLVFLEFFNGVTYIPDLEWTSDTQLELFTDSAGGSQLGGGAYFQGHWVFFPWPPAWIGTVVLPDITFLELVPVVLAFHIWGSFMSKRKIILHIDNSALVACINKKSSKSKGVMHLLRPFVLDIMINNIQCKATHLAGTKNLIADAISRLQLTRF
ncbi:uncharacterized protein LOC117332165 [Pecten maximus]|uniref:uncharacterized protein LOC117332165 n=1 Tax=Pecten maximus TaxID=6579 RepID=UPI0014584387|nr:uncharacterized protein LOC117332165 [Pecten maximus]